VSNIVRHCLHHHDVNNDVLCWTLVNEILLCHNVDLYDDVNNDVLCWTLVNEILLCHNVDLYDDVNNDVLRHCLHHHTNQHCDKGGSH
jgi:hypothetical protein